MIMETDNSLQCHLIKEIKVNCYKLLSVSVSSTYGFALFQYNNYNIKSIQTTVLEEGKNGDSDELDEFKNSDDDNQEIIGLFRKLNCDGRVLAQAMTDSYISFYDACGQQMADTADSAFLVKKQRRNIRPLHMIKLSNAPAPISMVEWNPKNPAMLAVVTPETLYTVLFDFELELSYILAQKDVIAPITALSWNPTGTQLTVGDADGRIHQFNPHLNLIRVVCPPRLIPSVFPGKFGCSGLCWVSKTERIVVFTSETSDKLHLTKLTVKPNKPPKWTVWDVLPAAESTEYGKTFTFLPVFKWNMISLVVLPQSLRSLYIWHRQQRLETLEVG
uniref:ANAPC4_WD40 domain-containing protein n=1 Tax=Panagrellus redivivus TaxID=6233 RepID=A0A7E4VS41_PANRE